MNGIDISHWQGGMKLENISADFVIMKATEGTYYVDDTTETFFSAAKKSGKLCGLYHFASGTNGASNEAKFFVDHIKAHLGEAILVLDWEGNAKNKGVGYAKEFLDTVYSLTGIRPFIYMSKSLTYSYNWSSVASDYPLWVAQYPDYTPIYGYQDKPWTDNKGYGAWKSPAIFQYTSSGYLNGWNKRLDLDKCYLTRDEWLSYQGKQPKPQVKEETVKPTPSSTTSTTKKTTYEIAKEVLDGKWGNGETRRELLTKAGYNYNIIQAEVNLLVVARDVIAGKYGNGLVRRAKLKAAGYDYNTIQSKVNKLLGY